MRAGCYPLRRQQQRRTGPSVCSRFDRPVRRIGHAVRLVPLGFVIGEQRGHAQTGDIERGRVISCAIPQAGGIATTEPRSPFHRLLAVSRGWGAIRFGRPMTMGAGMCRPARLDLTRSHAQEMAFCIASGKRMGNESVRVLATSLLLCCKDLPCAGYERFLFPRAHAIQATSKGGSPSFRVILVEKSKS
jgi:hypothetical protein